MILPHPEAKLAGCIWLPRLAAKIRVHLAGGLPRSYRVALGSRVGVDGYFLRHFQLSMAQVIAAVRGAPDDEALAAWFLKQPGATAEAIANWNAQAVKLGAVGQPAYWTLCVVKWFFYPKSRFRPIESIFEAIAEDEDLPRPNWRPERSRN
mgnify:CR=1 FL=1